MRQLKIEQRFTSRESLALEKYLMDIGRLDLLSPEQEADLAAKIKMGDELALETLAKANLRFVVSVAKQYQNQGLLLNDLINEGNVGLIKAAKRFDATKGFKFISYAVWWIRQCILQSIVDNSRMVRLPNSKASAYNKINNAYRSFVQEFERDPSVDEIAELLNISLREVEDVLNGANRHVSIDAPLMDGEDMTIGDTMFDEGSNPEKELIFESLQHEMNHSLKLLSEREAQVLKAYYGIGGLLRPQDLDEIAEMLDLSKERTRQIKDKAILKLRRIFNKDELMGYL
jgi:RNA polymerase primary sigma factor